MIQFHDTGYGRRFFDGQLPMLIAALERIANSLEALERTKRKAAPPAPDQQPAGIRFTSSQKKE